MSVSYRTCYGVDRELIVSAVRLSAQLLQALAWFLPSIRSVPPCVHKYLLSALK